MIRVIAVCFLFCYFSEGAVFFNKKQSSEQGLLSLENPDKNQKNIVPSENKKRAEGQSEELQLAVNSAEQSENLNSGKQPIEPAEEQEEETDVSSFQPSLSDTLSDSNKLKKQIQRQLAEEIGSDDEEKEDPKAVRSRASVPNSSDDTVARFGDLEVSISEREKEEDLEEVKK